MSSIKKNVLLNLLNTFTSLIFPIITFPYATRTLGIEGIGTVNFLGSTIFYICALVNIGIPIYAVKEVARRRDDLQQRNQCVVEILSLNLLLCVLGYLLVGILAYTVPSINQDRHLFAILSLSIFFTAAGINWFYQAIEEFAFITLRAIVFRLLAMAILFIFVKSPEDLMAYCWMNVFMTVGNNLINLIHLRKYIRLKDIALRKLAVLKHLKPSLSVFLPNVMPIIYGNINIILLGFAIDNQSVGVYSAGIKLIQIVLMVITSVSIVLLPRCSNLLKHGQEGEFRMLSHKTIRLILCVAFPCMVGLIILAEPLITILCGKEFLIAATVVQISAPVLLFIGLSNTIGIQMLYPMGKERTLVVAMGTGIVVNVILSWLLMPSLSYVGAAISSVVGEFIVVLIILWSSQRTLQLDWSHLGVVKYVVASALMASLLLITRHFLPHPNSFMITVVLCLGAAVLYLLTLKAMKDDLTLEVIDIVKRKLRRK